MSEELIKQQVIALGRFNLSQVISYYAWLELFQNAKVVNKQMIQNLTNYCKEMNEILPVVPTYFKETLPYLRKSRQILVLLNQRDKGKEINEPKLDVLFAENLENINNFFQKFNLQITEELSTPSLLGSDDVKRPLAQRIVNPDLDESRDFKNTIKRMAKTARSTGESSIEWKQLADGLLNDYESLDSKPTNYQIAEAELFLAGVNRLYERNREQKLSEERVTQLSAVTETPEQAKKRKRENLLKSIADNLISNENRAR